MLEVVTPSGTATLDTRLTRFEWTEVHLANFRTDEGLISATELARWAFEQLSSRGVGYDAPAAMLIGLAEGQSAAPLLEFLIDQLDPACVGEDEVYSAFGHWNTAQVDILLDFLSWAFNEFPVATHEKQHDTVREYWQARRKQISVKTA